MSKRPAHVPDDFVAYPGLKLGDTIWVPPRIADDIRAGTRTVSLDLPDVILERLDESLEGKPHTDGEVIERQIRRIRFEPSALYPGINVRAHLAEQDNVIVKDVILDDCYRVADLPYPAKSILDVGAHIGAATIKFRSRFTHAQIVAVEPHPQNFVLLAHNLAKDMAVQELEAAVTYEGGPLHLHGTVYDDCVTTGGSFVGPPGAHEPRQNAGEYRTHTPVRKVTVEKIMDLMGWEQIDVLKLDCEGSEFSILENAPLAKIGVVVGEWHDRDRMMAIARSMPRDTWDFDVLREGQIGLFRLAHKKWWNR